MKKTILFLAAAAALLLSACQKSESIAPEGKQVTVNFVASELGTKTVFGDKDGNKYPVLWTENDKQVGLVFNFGDITALPITPSADCKTATFSGKFDESSSYHFLIVSPYEAFKSRNKTDQTIMVEFPAGQTSTATSPDPGAQILFSNSGEVPTLPESVEVKFKHLSAYLHLQFTNVDLQDATVQAVNITSPDYYIAGRIYYKLKDGTFAESTSSLFHTIAITTSTLDDVWCGLRPVDFSGKTLSIVVATDKGTLTKEVTLPATAGLIPGAIGKLTVDMHGVELQKPVIYKIVTNEDELHVGDKVIIAAADLDSPYAMSTGQNTSNRSQAGVTKTATEIIDPAGEVEIIELADGFVPGLYALKATRGINDGYLYAGSLDGSSNILQTKDELDNAGSWSITIDDITIGDVETTGAAVIRANIPDPGHGIIRHNASSNLFSAYGPNSSQKAVKLYRLDVIADESARFNATLPGGNEISSAAQDIQVYVFGNVPWSATSTGEGATFDKENGTGYDILTLSVPANESTVDTKTYTVTVSTTGPVAEQTKSFTITQAKKVDTGGDPVKVYSFFLASAGNNLGSNGSYAGNCDIDIDGITWNVTGVSSSSDYAGWRLGGKSLNGINRCIYSKTALPHEVSKIVVSHSRANITINSYTLTVHSTAQDAASGANPIATLTATVEVGTQDAPKTVTFNKADTKSWAGCFYRFAYNVTNSSTSSNKYVEFRGLEMWGFPAE